VPWTAKADQVWTDTYTQLRGKYGNAFVSAIHLQCYSGGVGNSPERRQNP